MSDVSSLKNTIEPKSDQLNADDLIGGPITVTVSGVARGTPDQPVQINLAGGIRPYRPCKSMRRVLIACWGDDGRQWVGRSMTLYRDESVRFGGVQVGGIRISHLSHLAQPITVALTVTRAKRTPYTIAPLTDSPDLLRVLQMFATADTSDKLQAAATEAGKLTADSDKAKARAAYKARKTEIEKSGATGEPPITYAQIADLLRQAATADDLDTAADLIGEIADEQQRAELAAMYDDLRAGGKA